MADDTLTGTNGSDYLVDFNRPGSLFDCIINGFYCDVDLVYINGLGGDDTLGGLDSLTLYSINGGAGNDALFGFDSPDLLVGGSGNDYLFGYDDNDTLRGDGGNDTLKGGGSTDTLNGNTGNDVFKFDSVSDSQPGLLRDVIDDFVGNGIFAGDRIDLSTIDANSNIAGNQAFTYIGAGTFSAPGQVRYAGGILQGNTAGNLSAEFEIQLRGTPLLVASDIIL